MRRAQIPQVFLVIMALIVIGATVLLGTRLIGGLTSNACEANDASFQRDLKETIDEYATFGMRDKASVSTPCDAIELCFVDIDAVRDPSVFVGNDSTINASVRTGTRTNAFLKTRDDNMLAAGYDERIKLADRSEELCIPATGGKFTFDTEGKGRTITIRQIP